MDLDFFAIFTWHLCFQHSFNSLGENLYREREREEGNMIAKFTQKGGGGEHKEKLNHRIKKKISLPVTVQPLPLLLFHNTDLLFLEQTSPLSASCYPAEVYNWHVNWKYTYGDIHPWRRMTLQNCIVWFYGIVIFLWKLLKNVV